MALRRTTEYVRDGSGRDPSPALRARNAWIKTVHGVVSNLQFVQGMTGDEELRVFGPLRREEARADLRAAARNAPAAPSALPV